MDLRLARLVLGLTAGLVTVVLVDRFLLPGTLVAGVTGAVSAVAVLSFAMRKA